MFPGVQRGLSIGQSAGLPSGPAALTGWRAGVGWGWGEDWIRGAASAKASLWEAWGFSRRNC